MTTSSADTELLRSFVDHTAAVVAGAELARSEVASLQSSVREASPDYQVDAPIVDALLATLSAMRDNDRFVSTIRAELLASDVMSPGSAAVSDVRLQVVLDAAGLGVPPPALDFEPARLYGLPPTSGFVDDPICAANGNMVHQDLDLVFPGIAAALDLVRTYNSLAGPLTGAFGPGWSSVLDVRLLARQGRVEVVLPDGATAVFTFDGDRWQAQGRGVRRLDPDGEGWLLVVDELRSFRFDRRGALTAWTVWPAVVDVRRGSGRVVSVRERHSGRSWSVEWDEDSGCVGRVVSNDGRWVRYRRDDRSRLTRAGSMAGHLDYEWDDAFLAGVVDADGVRLFHNEYDRSGRVVRQTSPFGRTTSYRYEGDGLTVISDEHETRQAMVHDARGNLTAIIDTDGSAMQLRYDGDDRVVEIRDRGGASWGHRCDEHGRLTTRIDPDGLSESWAWDGVGRLIRRTDRSGAVTVFEYDDALRTPRRIVDPDGTVTILTVDGSIDRPVSVTGPDGLTTWLEYDTDGQPVAATGAAGRIEVSYDAAGRLTAVRGVDGTTTALVHDLTGRLVRCRHAGSVTTYVRTPAGRIAAGTHPGGGSWSAVFGDHGLPVEIHDDHGPALQFEYDPIGNVTAVIGPDGAAWRHEYDEAGRLAAVVDPLGARTRSIRDTTGTVVAFADATGRELRREVDVFGRTVRCIGTDGTSTAFTYDADGRTAAVAQHAPRGSQPTPGLQRAPEAVECRIERDVAGRVVAVGDATGVVARYEWNRRGLLVAAVDPAGLRTEYSYDRRGRLVGQTTPGGRVSTWAYDDAGRVAVSRDPAGVETRFERDPTGAVVDIVRGDVRCAVRRPARGERSSTATVIGAAFDPAGRILVDAEGTTYGYDRAGRLTRIEPPDAPPTAFEYDRDGLIAVERRGGDVRRFHYDIAGRVTALAVEGGPTTRFEYDSAGRRRREVCSDGSAVHYRWEGLDRLIEVARVTAGGVRSVTAVTGATDAGGALGGSLAVLGARVLDGDTHQFLSPDPLPTVPGSNGAASAYTYAWHDPVNFVDPSGMRPISQREWEAIRQREERGRLGEAWDAAADDPWGSLALGVVIAGGAVLCVTPLQPVGVGILIGAGASMGAGLASGTFDPRQAALAGLVGGVAGGAGAVGLDAGWSVATGGAVGAGGELAAQLLAGQPVDWPSVAVTGGVTSLTGGIANRLGGKLAVGRVHSAAVGGVTDAGGSVVTQALTGDHTLDLTEVVFEAAKGGATGAANDVFQGARFDVHATRPEPGTPWWPMPDPRSIVLDADGVIVRHVVAGQLTEEPSWP